MTTTYTAAQDARFVEYIEAFESGEAFTRKARSLGSVYGYQPVATVRGYAHAMRTIALLAERGEQFAQVAGAIFGRVNQYANGYEAAAQVYRAAAEALGRGFTDTRNLASPEPGRRRDNQRDYTVAERLAIMVYLDEAVRYLVTDTVGGGWAMTRALSGHHLEGLPEQVAQRAAR